jgi:prepilin-type N-terminal cleavage/methylation domain-containing protein
MKKAFTLVELLVVASIMAILTIVTVSQFRTARKRANDVARKGDLNSVAKALQLYFADYGSMPEASSKGEIMINGEVIKWGEEFKDSTGYIYMVKLPRENTTGDWPQYCYKTDETNKKYALFAKLEVESDEECVDENNNGIGDYSCGSGIVAGPHEGPYCYAVVSPNAILNSKGDIL